MFLGGREQGRLGDFSLGRRDQRLDKPGIVSGKSGYGLSGKQLGVVFEVAAIDAAKIDQFERRIELAFVVRHGKGLGLEPSEINARLTRRPGEHVPESGCLLMAMQHEERLKNRRAR